MEIAREAIPKVGDRNYFMGALMKEGKDTTENNLNQTYLKGIKELVVQELLKMYTYFQRLLDCSWTDNDQTISSTGLVCLNVSSWVSVIQDYDDTNEYR